MPVCDVPQLVAACSICAHLVSGMVSFQFGQYKNCYRVHMGSCKLHPISASQALGLLGEIAFVRGFGVVCSTLAWAGGIRFSWWTRRLLMSISAGYWLLVGLWMVGVVVQIAISLCVPFLYTEVRIDPSCWRDMRTFRNGRHPLESISHVNWMFSSMLFR